MMQQWADYLDDIGVAGSLGRLRKARSLSQDDIATTLTVDQ